MEDRETYWFGTVILIMSLKFNSSSLVGFYFISKLIFFVLPKRLFFVDQDRQAFKEKVMDII